ncbi:MAG: M20/M25/M40 family metallo-hydrolase [Victivallaceae bacterium]|nr:M20/M25/M40 family metallo-hydrolase [Victivallaceae bacterium]
MGKESLEILSELIGMRAVTADVEAVNSSSERMGRYLTDKGLLAKFETLGERRILYGSTVDTKRPDLLLCVHLDVVPANTDDQYEAKIVGDRLYGRGSNDCIGNAVACADAMAELKDLSVGCIFSSDEEDGGTTTSEMVRLGYAPGKAMLVLDDWNDNCICYAHKGVATVKLIARGHGGHASAPWLADNPIDKLVRGYAAFMANWSNPADADDWRRSLTPCIVSAGRVHNQIPDDAEMVLNIRTVAGELDGIVEELRRTTGLEVVVQSVERAFASSVDCPEFGMLEEAYLAGFGVRPGKARICGATDARHFQGMAPVYIFGVAGEGLHDAGEYVVIDSIESAKKTVVEFARRLAAAK